MEEKKEQMLKETNNMKQKNENEVLKFLLRIIKHVEI